MHNAVNIQNGKEVWTYDGVYEKYSSLYGGGGKTGFSLPNMDTYIIFILFIVIIIVVYLYYNKNFKMSDSFY